MRKPEMNPAWDTGKQRFRGVVPAGEQVAGFGQRCLLTIVSRRQSGRNMFCSNVILGMHIAVEFFNECFTSWFGARTNKR